MRIKIKKSFVILTMVLALQLISSTIFAQVPQKMSYQAVIRDASKALVTNKTIGMRVRIAQGTQSGTIVYTETFSPTTNINGLVSLEIGGAAGFSAINWANGPYFILTDADLTGGTSYTISGYSQLVSVPYALYAKTAESLVGGTTIPSGTTLPTPVSVTGSFYFKTDENILYVSNGTAWLPLSTHGSTPSGTTFPAPTNPGDVFFNTANKNFYYWDGTTWKLVSNIPNGTTLPAASASVVGDPFFKTDTNILYVFNGTSWNPINGLSSTLADGSLFVGNASNVATPTTKANIPISGFGAATADVSLGNKNITNLATPLISGDAANKLYVDSKVSTNLSGPALPAVGPAGNTFFNTTDKVFYISDGTKWLPVATDGSTPSGPTFPPLPSPGDVFYNTATNSYYFYDGTSWKLASSIPTGSTLPLTGTSGDPFFKTDTNTFYIYTNGAWTVAGLSNILANGSFFVGDASNIATATTKTNIPLSGFGVPTTSVSMGSQKLTNVATPTADPDAANKAYVDSKSSTTPTGPALPAIVGAAGNTFFNTTDKILYISDGTKWLPVATDGSTPNGPTNPLTAKVGDVFYNSTLNAFYYYDGTNWKIISGVPLGPTNPVTGLPGETFYNTTNNTLYVNNGTTWNSTKVQANWTQNTVTADDYIKNKPTLVSQFTNDAGYLTTLGLPAAETDPIWNSVSSNYYTKLNSQTSGGAQLHFNNITNKPTTLVGYGITDAADANHNHAVDALSNVTITGKANNDILQWDNVLGKWVNKALVTTVVSAEADPIVKAINGIVKSNGTVISGAVAGTDYVAPNVGITGATKTKITYDSKGLVTAGADATTADIAPSTNRNYVTDNQLTVVANTSGINTGDQNASQVAVTPAGNISSTNVQSALVELQGDINGLTTSSHAAVTLGAETNGLSLTGQQLSLAAATAGIPGALSAADKTKLDGITAGAEVNVQADWAQVTNTADDYIRNKPIIYTAVELSTNFPGSAAVHWKNITNTPTNLSGYGIIGAMDNSFAAYNILQSDINKWNNIASMGVTSVTATGPLSSSGGTTPDISITGSNLTSTDLTVTGGTGATLTATSLAIADNAITNAKMADNSIGTVELQSSAVTTAKITDSNVTAAKLTAGAGTAGRVAIADAAGAVSYGNIPSSSVNGSNLTSTELTVTGGTGATLTTTSLSITDNAITNSKMADNAVGTVELTDNAVTTPKIADDNITTSKIANANVTTAKIADLNVTAGKLTAGAGTAGRVAIADAAGTVTYGNIPSSSVNGANLTSTDLTVTGGTGTTLVATSLAITDGAVTTAKIADGTITDADLNKGNIPISGFAPAAIDVSMGSKKITNLAKPEALKDAANKQYVDEAIHVPGNLYLGTVASNLPAFNALDWSTISIGPNDTGLKDIPTATKICTLEKVGSYWTWIAFPKAWGTQTFFFRYGGVVYSVFDGFEKRVISDGVIDYQVWVFKTTPDVDVDLIVNN